jgi:hypothetical protein
MVTRRQTSIPNQIDTDERELLQAAATNPAFNSLKEAEEETHTLAERKPFLEQGKTC